MTKTIHHPAYNAMIRHLCDRRRELGMTQEDVAGKLGVSRTWVGKVENLERRLDFLETVDLCHLYGIPLHDLARRVGS
jgi:transcriptional regulator with XRE-family HTH domain